MSTQKLESGQLRMAIQDSGITFAQTSAEAVRVIDDTIFVEFTNSEGVRTLAYQEINSAKCLYCKMYGAGDIVKILRDNNRSHLITDDSQTNSSCMGIAELAKKLDLDAKVLRKNIPTHRPGGEHYFARNKLEKNPGMFKSFPASLSFGPISLAPLFAMLSGGKILDAKNITIKESEPDFPYVENGFLKIPGTSPAFQISSAGAFLKSEHVILSIDKEGVLFEISISNTTKPHVQEICKLKLPNIANKEIGGICGFEKGRVFFITAANKNETSMYAISADNYEILGEVKGVGGEISCDNVGNVYFVDSEKNVKVVSTNIAALSGKAIVPRVDESLLAIKNAAAALDGLQIPSIDAPSQAGPEPEIKRELINLQSKMQIRIGPEISKCKTLKEVQNLELRLQSVRERPDLAAVPAVFQKIDEEISVLKERLAFPEFNLRLDELEKALKLSSPNIAECRAALLRLVEDRARVVFKDSKNRVKLNSRIKELTLVIEGLNGKADKQSEKFVSSNLAMLAEELSSCATQDEVMTVVMEGGGKAIRDMIAIVSDRKIRDNLNSQLQKVIDERISEITKILQADKLREAEALLRVREEFNSLIEQFKNSLTAVNTRDNLQEQANSPVAKAIKQQIQLMPEEDRENATNLLSRMIAERAKTVDFSKQVYDLTKKTGYVKFGKVEFPKAGNYEVLCHADFKPIAARPGFLELVWTDTRGKQFKPEVQPISLQAAEDERKALISSTQEEANKYFQSLSLKPPKILSHWIINKHYEEYLEEFSELLMFQRTLQRGFTIIEGDAGAAKSAIVQMFCALTNRPMFTFACNGQTEKEDLTYIYQYDPVKGTYRLDSGFIEALQTPNALVLLEEINSLPTPVAKMLNTLFDFKRELYLPDGRIIKADPSVLMVGLQNPQTYAGVNKLSKEFLSRAIVMNMDYAQEKDGSTFLPYEAEMYAKYRPVLASLSQDEFYALWDKVVNKRSTALSDKVSTPERKKEVEGLHRLVSIANSARRSYRAYQNEESNDSFEFIFSYREAEAIAHLWDGKSKIENMIARVVLPKITEAIERKAMEAMIRSKPAAVNIAQGV